MKDSCYKKNKFVKIASDAFCTQNNGVGLKKGCVVEIDETKSPSPGDFVLVIDNEEIKIQMYCECPKHSCVRLPKSLCSESKPISSVICCGKVILAYTAV